MTSQLRRIAHFLRRRHDKPQQWTYHRKNGGITTGWKSYLCRCGTRITVPTRRNKPPRKHGIVVPIGPDRSLLPSSAARSAEE